VYAGRLIGNLPRGAAYRNADGAILKKSSIVYSKKIIKQPGPLNIIFLTFVHINRLLNKVSFHVLRCLQPLNKSLLWISYLSARVLYSTDLFPIALLFGKRVIFTFYGIILYIFARSRLLTLQAP